MNAIVKPQQKIDSVGAREIEEAMKKVKEAQSLITAAIDPGKNKNQKITTTIVNRKYNELNKGQRLLIENRRTFLKQFEISVVFVTHKTIQILILTNVCQKCELTNQSILKDFRLAFINGFAL